LGIAREKGSRTPLGTPPSRPPTFRSPQIWGGNVAKFAAEKALGRQDRPFSQPSAPDCFSRSKKLTFDVRALTFANIPECRTEEPGTLVVETETSSGIDGIGEKEEEAGT